MKHLTLILILTSMVLLAGCKSIGSVIWDVDSQTTAVDE